MSPQPVKYDSPRPELNLLYAEFQTVRDDVHGHGVVSGREVPKRYRGRSYRSRVMIERVIQRRMANRYVASNDFQVWVERFNDWTGVEKTREELEGALREPCNECR